MFSATFPEAIRNVAKEFLNNYLFLRFLDKYKMVNHIFFTSVWELLGEPAQMWTSILMR